MKKHLLLTSLLALTSLSLVTGCENNNSEDVKSDFQVMLENLRKGVKFKGELYQKSTFLNGPNGEKTDDFVENTYNIEFTYQSQDENGYSAYVTVDNPVGDDIVWINTNAFEGEDGFAYYYDLNYDNTVKSFPYYETNGKDKLNFAYYYINPFHYLLEEDFTKLDDTTYLLSNEKANFFASNVLGDIDLAFFEVNKSCKFTVENGELKSIEVIPMDVNSETTDYETWETVYYHLEQRAVLSIDKVGDVKIEKPTPNVVPADQKDAISKLQNALKKFEGNNYTMKLEGKFLDENGTQFKENCTYYFDGNNMYFTMSEDPTTPIEGASVLFYKDGKEYITLGYSEEDSNSIYAFTEDAVPTFLALEKSYTKEEIYPLISEVNADIFAYNSKYNNYTVNEAMIPYIGSMALIPPINTFSYYTEDCGTKLLVRLTSTGDIDYISYDYKYDDGFFFEDGEIKITFENIGSTKIPFEFIAAY